MKLTLRNLKFIIGKTQFARICFNLIRERKLLTHYYKGSKKKPSYNGIVFCVDGHIKHGGMGDRFFGLLQTYALCKIHNVDF